MINYLLASLVVISCVLAGANFLAWRLFERPRHAVMWALTYGLAGVQYSINLARDLLPSEAIYWQSANMVSFAVMLFALWGHRDRLGLSSPRSLMVMVFAGLSLVSALVTFGNPAIAVRTAIAPGFSFLVMTHVAFILVREANEPRLAQHVAAAIHLLFGITQGLAAAIAVNFRSEPNQELYALYNAVNFGLMPTLFVAMGVSVIFLLATDLARRLSTMALRDYLTGLNNRRGYLAATETLLAHCQRREHALTILLVDIDYFKRINDRYGHSIGDRALQHFTRILQESVRAEDVLGRIGGEEFAVTLAEMGCAEAELIAARIRQGLCDQPMMCGRDELPMRASFGLAQWQELDDIAEVIRRADVALYQAKASGRDAIVVSKGRSLVGMVSNG